MQVCILYHAACGSFQYQVEVLNGSDVRSIVAGLKKRLLIVDDEAGIRDSLRLLLKQNFEVLVAADGRQALETVEKQKPDLILLDIMMPVLDGIETLKALRERQNNTPVVMLTAANTVRSAVEAMKLGAVDYLNKPFDIDELTSLIIHLLENEEEGADSQKTQLSVKAEGGTYNTIIGHSPGMAGVLEQIRQIAEKDTTVLITGESGTGKELIAREIHKRSRRNDMPFIALNCAAIPETLIESELFGHEKGAFTSAVENRVGHFELADGGTLFLDEIGELTLPVQVKLLRFLQDHEFYRLGRTKPIHVDVRLITATNRNLEDLLKEKKFRQDLFYRIHVVNVLLPPLRDRYEDIPVLCEHFMTKFSPLYDEKMLKISPEAMDVLIQYEWPGNVRELENVIESLMALCPAEVVEPKDLPVKFSRHREDGKHAPVFEGSLRFEDAERIFETEMLPTALRRTNYVQTKAAELLGISRRILKYKMDKLGIGDREAGEKEEAPETDA